MELNYLIKVALLGFLSLEIVNSSRISILPFSVGGSHFMVLKRLAEELENRGHEITFIVADRYADTKGQIFKHHVYKADIENQMKSILDSLMAPGGYAEFRLPKAISLILDTCKKSARGLLKNHKAMKEIKQSDLLITESMFFTAPLIAEFANIPRIDLASSLMSFFNNVYGIQSPSSYVPATMTPFTDRMSFPQRLLNTLLGLVTQAFSTAFILWNQYNGFMAEIGIPAERRFKDIYRQTRALIVQADFAVEYIQPLPPHVHFVGPILPKPSSPLPQEFENIMQNSGEDGVVIIAFGSYLDSGSIESCKEMIEGFSRVKQTFIWKTSLNITGLPPNIKTFDWLPQNDLLGHSQTKAFVSHMGHNSAYEAAYHGVPILAVPLMNDQPSVARKMTNRAKMALTIDKDQASANEWQKSITEVVTNKWYKGNATRVSSLLKSKGFTSAERAASIVEQVLAEGPNSHHLNNPGNNLGFLQLQSFDVIMTFLLIFVVSVKISLKLMFKFIRTLRKRMAKKDKKE